MDTSFAHECFDFLLPIVRLCGDYTVEVQKRIQAQPTKEEYDDLHSQALTDADLSVQNVIEVALLTRFPELDFRGEENDRSLNAKYFSSTSGFSLYLDPVDGTRLYMDGLDDFNIIVGLVNSQDIVAGMIYFPRRGYWYLAFRGEGALYIPAGADGDRDSWQPLTVKSDSEKILVASRVFTYKVPELDATALDGFSVYSLPEDYNPEFQDNNPIGFLGGSYSAVAVRGGAIHDCGVHAFIAREAGATVTTFAGEALPRACTLKDSRYDSILIASSEPLHQRLIALLS